MKALGFEECKVTNGVFAHGLRDLRAVAHVDDFLVVGEKHECKAFLVDLKKDFEVEGGILGIEVGEVETIKFLGRTFRATVEGLEIEADQKLARSIVEKANLLRGSGVDTPGLSNAASEGGPGQPLVGEEATLYRRGVAKINYLAQD